MPAASRADDADRRLPVFRYSGGLVVIDEFQQRPDLLPLLRVLLDRQPLPARFLLLGSASPDIVRGALRKV